MKQIKYNKLAVQDIEWHKHEGGLVGTVRLPKSAARTTMPIGFVDPVKDGFRAMLTVPGASQHWIVKKESTGKALVKKALKKHVIRQIQKLNLFIGQI